MSKGNAIISIRIPQRMLEDMGDAIESRNLHSAREPWDQSEFVRQAIREKLDHNKRGRRRYCKKGCIDKIIDPGIGDAIDKRLAELKNERAGGPQS